MTDSPAKVASSLLSSTVVGGVSTWTLRIGYMPDTPDKIVLFTDSGGQNPNPRWRIDYPTFQVRVRAPADGYAEAYSKAREVRDVLLGLDSQTIGTDRWVSLIVLGDIGFMGSDESGRPEFSVNFRAIIEPASGANRDSL